MSSTQSSGRNKAVVATAVGAGVLILGAAGAYLYHHFSENKKKLDNVKQEMARLDLALSELRQELLALRNSRSVNSSRSQLVSSRSRKSSFSSVWSGNETEDDWKSAFGDQDSPNYLNSEDEETFMSANRSQLVSSRSRRSSFNSFRDGNETEDDWKSAFGDQDSPNYLVSEDEETTLADSESSKLFEKVDILLKQDDEDKLKAFNLLKKHEIEMADHPDFLWRYAKAHQMQATACGAQKDTEGKKNHIFQGLEYASRALELDPSNPDVHKWFAILTGMQADFVPIKQKIQNGFLFQKHVLIAIQAKPDDYSLHHLLGRFKLEMANISWIERKLAASFFGEIPEVTYSDAITDFLEAEKLNPTPWKENRLLLAKCYIGQGNYDKAIHWLNSCDEVVPKTKEDECCHEETKNLLQKYNKYVK